MNSIHFFHLFVVQVIAFVFFLVGFLPIPNKSTEYANVQDLPHDLNGFRLNPKELYFPKVDRIVLIVIDALRADYILQDDLESHMPFFKKLHNEEKACTYLAKAHTPTVTLPRIKALASGSIPGFADVILNLGSPEMNGDSIIHQIIKSGRKVIFYGDETWLRLFPGKFLRSEGTTSFFVNDYTEVDANVTRHLNRELQRSDWSVMILHYLGLDHIGHISGPKSPLISLKLSEMDQVIQKIHEQLPERSAIIICGDHGMSDSGSHGGSSPAETDITLSFVLNGCNPHPKVNLQVDLAPTTSALLGIPPPANSLGSLIEGILSSESLFTPEQRLYASYVNARTVAKQYQSDELLLKTVKLYDDYLHGVGTLGERNITESFLQATELMNSHLIDNLVTFDLYLMVVAIILSFQILFLASIECVVGCEMRHVGSSGRMFFCGIIFASVIVHVTACLSAGSQSCACFAGQRFLLPFLVNVVVFVAYSINIWSIMSRSWLRNCKKLSSGTGLEHFLLIGTVVQAVSLGSSSFVEEEHQVFYFFGATFVAASAVLERDRSRRLRLVGSLVLMRVARTWNQTGDKWINEPDVEDWLNAADNKTFLTVSSVAGALGIFHWIECSCRLNRIQRIASGAALVAALAYRAALGTLGIPYPSSMGIAEAAVAYASMATVFFASRRRSEAGRIVWILLTSLLKRPHHLPLTVLQLWQYTLMLPAIDGGTLRPFYRGLAHYWLALVWYFQQGNANNLARIDLSAGYVGLSRYSPLVVGFLLSCATYSGPIMSLLFSLEDSSARSRSAFLWARSLTASLFFVTVTALRHHLFVWTVFSPKLLYDGAFACFLLAVCACTARAGVESF